MDTPINIFTSIIFMLFIMKKKLCFFFFFLFLSYIFFSIGREFLDKQGNTFQNISKTFFRKKCSHYFLIICSISIF
jgi:hypothetical protein